jgi:thiamine pyrophosphate-dependent acetolactate synthase large subunit-like protein
MSKGSDLLVAALENEGVEGIFGVPGEENLDVLAPPMPFWALCR